MNGNAFLVLRGTIGGSAMVVMVERDLFRALYECWINMVSKMGYGLREKHVGVSLALVASYPILGLASRKKYIC